MLTYLCIMRRIFTIGMNTIRGFANPAFNFLIVVFGVKIFGKTDWASLINVLLWVYFTTFMLSWGNYDYLLRKFSNAPGKMYHAFVSNFLSRSLLLPFSLLLLFFFPLHIALWAIVLVLLTFCYASLLPLVVYHQKFTAQVIAETVSFVIIFGSIFYVKIFELEIFLQIYTIAIAVKLFILSLQLNFWRERFSAKISLKEFKLGLPFFILGLSGFLISKSDIYIVDSFLEKSQLAEYQLLITSFLMLQALSAYIIIPFTKHVYRVSDEVVQKMKYRLYAASVPLVVVGGIVIWFVMEYFVELGFGYEYYVVGALLALPSFFYTLNVMELMKNHQERRIIYVSFFTFFVSTSLIVLLIEPYEIFGILLSVCIAQWTALLTYKLYRKFG